MSDSRKRRGSAALPSYMRYARPRHNPADEGSLVKAITVAHNKGDVYEEGLLGALELYAWALIGRIYGARLARQSTTVYDNTQVQLCREGFW